MAKIAHYIITRFNLRSEASQSQALDPRWLAHRFDLFEKFCLPTVKAQTLPDFSWLVLFDTDTPLSIRERLARLAHWPTIRPIFFPPGTQHVGKRAVEAVMHETPDLLITTRLDNDDGIACRYIEWVRKHCLVHEPTVLQFPSGYVWYDRKLYRDRQHHNPFQTLVEPMDSGRPDSFTTIYTGAHHDSHKLGRVVTASEEPGWLQVVHGGNLANRRRGIRVPASALQSRFGLDEGLLAIKENRLEFLMDVARSGLIEAARSLRQRIS